jgi:hypothetical protein
MNFNYIKTATVIIVILNVLLNIGSYYDHYSKINTSRKLYSTTIKPIPCNPGTNGTTCVCPNTQCLEYSQKIDGCHPIDCWKWNEIKQECQEDGKPFIPAIILQSIPFTGYFGSGFGNMGRWDIFGFYWIVIGSGCLCSCCMSIGASCFVNDEEKNGASKLGCSCGSCFSSIALTVIWIWGIVVIANKEVDAPYLDWEGNIVLCPLV